RLSEAENRALYTRIRALEQHVQATAQALALGVDSARLNPWARPRRSFASGLPRCAASTRPAHTTDAPDRLHAQRACTLLVRGRAAARVATRLCPRADGDRKHPGSGSPLPALASHASEPQPPQQKPPPYSRGASTTAIAPLAGTTGTRGTAQQTTDRARRP